MAVNQHSFILKTDGYKISHFKQYPPKTEYVYSYLESRGGRFNKTLFFGLQYLIKKHFKGKVVYREDIKEAKEYASRYFGSNNPNLFNEEGWRYIVEEHGGKLPIIIKAVPEGTVVPTNNVLVTVENTDPKCYWLTNYVETLLVQLWYPITVATQSMYMKQIIKEYVEATGNDSVDFKLHDFGYRGVSCHEQAEIGGMSHLVSFMGTDTVAGDLAASNYYGNEQNIGFGYGYSIPASEHSTITSWGKENEVDAMRNMLEIYPDGLVACVSDSYDIYEACENKWGKELKDMILERDGVLVVRPDSGEPKQVIGKVMNILGEKFGFTINDKGYKVLNPKVRVIQGDGIDIDSMMEILNSMTMNKWSADNIAFGSGGGLLQKLNRDTCKFAFKCSSITIDGEEKDVYKNPVTDPGKKSKRGRLRLEKINGSHGSTYATYEHNCNFTRLIGEDCLETVFKNGNIINHTNFEDVRKRADIDKAFYGEKLTNVHKLNIP